MRIEVISIFPEYFSAAELSLLGKARQAGLLEMVVHDLRDWTEDRHRTVDDTPYGGGAGMVMLPEVWGRALDQVAPPGSVIILPTPSGRLFTQAMAESLVGAERLVFACGRYEGIDARVAQHFAARQDLTLLEVSVGDYVLAGGEVAALVMIEAITRLLPGVLGNAESLTEESHSGDGLLEYPLYTKPPLWRDLAVPPVLLSGDHAKIAAWRAEAARLRTATNRPELLDTAAGPYPASAHQLGVPRCP